MQSEYDTILSEVFCDVLINYGFMFGDPAPKDELLTSDTDYLRTTVSFAGHRTGVIGISTPADLGAQLAANVLGLEPDDDDSIESALDAVKELVNIVCGQFLTSAFGDEPIFDLLPPVSLEIDKAEWDKLLESEETMGFMVEDEPAILYVSIESEDKEKDDDQGSGGR